MTGQPGEREQQPDPSPVDGQDSPVAGTADAIATDATATGTIPVTARPPADGSGLAAGSGKRWRPFPPWRDRSARRSADRQAGNGQAGSAGPEGPANGPTTPSPDGTGAPGDPPPRTSADGSAEPREGRAAPRSDGTRRLPSPAGRQRRLSARATLTARSRPWRPRPCDEP